MLTFFFYIHIIPIFLFIQFTPWHDKVHKYFLRNSSFISVAQCTVLYTRSLVISVYNRFASSTSRCVKDNLRKQ